MFFGVRWVGVEDVLGVGLAVGDVEGLDIGHGGEEADDCFVGVDVGHGALGVGGVGMDTQLPVDKPLDAGLEAVFEAVLTGGDSVVNSATGEVAPGKNQSVHLGVDGEIILHGALGERELGLDGALWEAIISYRYHPFVLVNDGAAHFG